MRYAMERERKGQPLDAIREPDMPSGTSWQHLPSRYTASMADYLPTSEISSSQTSTTAAAPEELGTMPLSRAIRSTMRHTSA